MKTILSKAALVAAVSFALAGCSAGEQVFTIKGQLPGAPDGTVVKICFRDVWPEQSFDSTRTVNGRFELQAEDLWAFPRECRLVVGTEDNKPEMRRCDFFAENAAMTFNCPLDSMQHYYWSATNPKYRPQIAGSESEQLNDEFKAHTRAYSHEISSNRKQYFSLLRDKANVDKNRAELFDYLKKMDDAQEKWNQEALAFVKDHPASVVGAWVVQRYLRTNTSKITKEQINAAVSCLSPELQGSQAMIDVDEAAVEAMALAKGRKFHDGVALNLKGEQAKLSDYIQPGKYNMLEFWASWCGPCRGEIPHLRRIYGISKNEKFNIISISIDDEDAEWQKAVKEENMEWNQLRCGEESGISDLMSKYHVHGVPSSFMLDPDGNIITGDVRGAQLDFFLQEALGMEFK